jgi:hypothetical protein
MRGLIFRFKVLLAAIDPSGIPALLRHMPA